MGLLLYFGCQHPSGLVSILLAAIWGHLLNISDLFPLFSIFEVHSWAGNKNKEFATSGRMKEADSLQYTLENLHAVPATFGLG